MARAHTRPFIWMQTACEHWGTEIGIVVKGAAYFWDLKGPKQRFGGRVKVGCDTQPYAKTLVVTGNSALEEFTLC